MISGSSREPALPRHHSICVGDQRKAPCMRGPAIHMAGFKRLSARAQALQRSSPASHGVASAGAPPPIRRLTGRAVVASTAFYNTRLRHSPGSLCQTDSTQTYDIIPPHQGRHHPVSRPRRPRAVRWCPAVDLVAPPCPQPRSRPQSVTSAVLPMLLHPSTPTHWSTPGGAGVHPVRSRPA